MNAHRRNLGGENETSSIVDEVLSRYRPSAPTYKTGEKAPVSGTYTCYRGTMLPPVRIQITKSERFPEAEGVGAHARWQATDAQA